MNTGVVPNTWFPIEASSAGSQYLDLAINTGFVLTFPTNAVGAVIFNQRGSFLYRLDSSPVNGVNQALNFLAVANSFTVLTSKKALKNFKGATSSAAAAISIQYFAAIQR